MANKHKFNIEDFEQRMVYKVQRKSQSALPVSPPVRDEFIRNRLKGLPRANIGRPDAN